MAIIYRGYSIALNTDSRTVSIRDGYDHGFTIEHENGLFIITELKFDKETVMFKTDNMYDAFEFVKDWT